MSLHSTRHQVLNLTNLCSIHRVVYLMDLIKTNTRLERQDIPKRVMGMHLWWFVLWSPHSLLLMGSRSTNTFGSFWHIASSWLNSLPGLLDWAAPGYRSKHFVAAWSMIGTNRNFIKLSQNLLHREPMQIFLILSHQARKGKTLILGFFFLSPNYKKWFRLSSTLKFPKLKSISSSHPHLRIYTWETRFLLGNHQHLNFF